MNPIVGTYFMIENESSCAIFFYRDNFLFFTSSLLYNLCAIFLVYKV